MKKSAYTVITVTAFLMVVAVALAAGTPSVTTSPASAIGVTGATLQGQYGGASSNNVYFFEYGPTTAYGSQTPSTSVSSKQTQAVQATVTGLTPGTGYHFRLVVDGSGLPVNGPDQSFTTTGVAAPAAPSPPTAGGSGAGPTAPGGNATSPVEDPFGGVAEPGVSNPGLGSRATTPVMGASVAAGKASGSVLVKAPNAASFTPLSADASMPVGTTIDASRGVVSLVTAVDSNGRTQAARFTGGVFQISQSASGHGVTDIALRGGDFSVCRKPATRAFRLGTSTHAAPRAVRGLWGSDSHGRFRTRGSHAIATVRGTVWMVADRCDGTLTKVAKGAVSVQDLTTHRTVLVKAGKSYLARTRRR